VSPPKKLTFKNLLYLKSGPALDKSGHNRRRPNAETEGKEATRPGRRRFNFDSRNVLKARGKRDRSERGSSRVGGGAEGAIRMRKTADVAVSCLNQSGEDQKKDAQKTEIKFSRTARV
jgi:hypothetical protein